jgi:phosphoglycerate dehydrogenase-like enzyme
MATSALPGSARDAAAPLTVVYSGQAAAVPAVRETLGAHAVIVEVPEHRDAILDALSRADVYFATIKVRLDAEMIANAPNLRLVVTASTGSDHADQVALSARGIPFLNLKHDREFLNTITPTAELAFLHVLAAARHLRAAVAQPLAGEWNSEAVAGRTLYQRSLGLVGLGRLGSWMARYGAAFGMRVLAHDPYVTNWPIGVERCDLDVLLAESDFISIHVHLSDETRGLLSADRIARIKAGAALVNTSRGAIVDEAAVIDALRSGRLAAYGCDVLDGELDAPIGDHPLVSYAREHSNVTITPHMGGVSLDALQRTAAFSAAKILHYFHLDG